MDIGSVLKDNIKVFLPVLGLAFVLIAFYTLDLDAYLFTDLTFNNKPSVNQQSLPEMALEDNISYKAKVRTETGDFVVDLFKENAPVNVNNFVFLAENGFYKNSHFHRVIKDFSIQAGDTKGDGTGDAGYSAPYESLKNIGFGSYNVGMANSSQFFVTSGKGSFDHLNSEYTIIGRVVEGFEVVDEIGNVKVDSDYAPKKKVLIRGIDIIKESK
jgi:cyclophilin family peptidyl-prolyl cis-trans isomerase